MDFNPYELYTTNVHTKIFTLKHEKFEKKLIYLFIYLLSFIIQTYDNIYIKQNIQIGQNGWVTQQLSPIIAALVYLTITVDYELEISMR